MNPKFDPTDWKAQELMARVEHAVLRRAATISDPEFGTRPNDSDLLEYEYDGVIAAAVELIEWLKDSS